MEHLCLPLRGTGGWDPERINGGGKRMAVSDTGNYPPRWNFGSSTTQLYPAGSAAAAGSGKRRAYCAGAMPNGWANGSAAVLGVGTKPETKALGKKDKAASSTQQGDKGDADMVGTTNLNATAPPVAADYPASEQTRQESQQEESPQEANGTPVVIKPSALETEALAKGGKGKPTYSGLLRSPSTGGVQSATSSHGLPDPAVAVRNLIAQSKNGHLCTVMSRMHHRRAGYPFSSLIDFATDAGGHPVFSLSPLHIHARNLVADPRCTLVVQIPGWSGLADARVTFFGDVFPVPEQHQDWANGIFCLRHKQEHSSEWGNSRFFRMEVLRDIYFVGGFGTVSWVDTQQYMSVEPDRIARDDSERTLEELNSSLGARLRESLDSLVKSGAPAVEEVRFIAVDGKGVDIRVQQGSQAHVRRISFESQVPVETVEHAQGALEDLLSRSALPLDLVEHQQ